MAKFGRFEFGKNDPHGFHPRVQLRTNMRIKLAALLVALFAISLPQSGQGVKDVDGWNGAKWSMNPAQVQAAMVRFGLPIEKDPKLPLVWKSTKNLPVYSLPMEVVFVFEDDKLSAVKLFLSDDYMEGLATAHERSRCFDELKKGLTEKYGKPTDEQTKNEDGLVPKSEHSVWWTFPSTRITLDDWEMPEGRGYKGNHMLHVEYKHPIKNAL